MLLDFIRKAVELGADELEIDYKDGQERICAMRGPVGVGIGTVKSSAPESAQLFVEVEALRKAKHVDLDAESHSAKVSEFDSFGEAAYRIQLTRVKAARRT